MSRSNRWRYFLLVFICKAAETSTIKVSDSTMQGFNINNDYGLDYTVQDNERAFQINEDYLNITRRINFTPSIARQRQDGKSINCDKCGTENTQRRLGRRIAMTTPEPIRILGGEEVKRKRKYPWQVGIFRDGDKRGGVFFCGGSIINNRWILTAAHCFYDFKENKCPLKNWFYKKKPGLKVRVGEHNQGSKKDDDKDNTVEYNIDVRDIVFHPWNKVVCPTFLKYDFALLKLNTKIPLNAVIRPICLQWDDNERFVGKNAIVSGWGSTRDQTWSSILKEFEYKIATHTECSKDWKIYDENIHMCAGPVPHKGPCVGDSGGPLMVKKNIGKYFQVGVVSFGPKECGLPRVSMYGKVSNPIVFQWIKQITADGDCTVS